MYFSELILYEESPEPIDHRRGSARVPPRRFSSQKK